MTTYVHSNCLKKLRNYKSIAKFKNCQELRKANPNAQSGVYKITSNLEVYCEMTINGGGYTFLPWSTINASSSILDSIYTDKTQVLFRLIGKTNENDQKYAIISQLTTYQTIPISIQINKNVGYHNPVNNVGPYIYFGLLPMGYSKDGDSEGFSANGQDISFIN